MKKIIGILLAGALVTSAFAADFNATVKMKGNVLAGNVDLDNNASTNTNSFSALKLDKDFVDNSDLFVTSFTGDKAGAEVKIKLNSWALEIASAKVWIQPIDMLKITFGDSEWTAWNETTYTYGRMGPWKNGWFAENGGRGFDVLITPVSGLEFDVGFKAGNDANWFGINNTDVNFGTWNVGAKANLNALAELPLEVLFNFQNSYKQTWGIPVESNKKYETVLSLGAKYAANNFEAHLVGRYGFKYDSQNGGLDKKLMLDNGFKYSIEGFTAWLSVPVMIDMYVPANAANEFSLGYLLKVAYAMNGTTVHAKIHDTDFDKLSDSTNVAYKYEFTPTITVGVDFNVGSCAMGVSFETTIPKTNKDLNWKVPFFAKVSF
jgi:hypothetical protein